MATRRSSQGRANDPIVVDSGTADQTVPACPASRDETSSALGHADGGSTRRSDSVLLHHVGFSKGEHPVDASSTPTPSRAARFPVRSVHADGGSTQRSDSFLVHHVGFYKGEHRTDASSTPTPSPAARLAVRSVLMDHADGIPSRRSGCSDRLHPSSTPISSRAERFDDVRSVLSDHTEGVRYLEGKHPMETTSIPTSGHAELFDVRSVPREHADGIPSRRSGCLDLRQPGRFFNDEQPTTMTSASPTSRQASRFNVHSVVMDMEHAERVQSQRGCFARMSSKAGILLMFLLILPFVGAASGSPAVCPRSDSGALVLHLRGHVCYVEHKLAFTEAMASADPAPSTSPIPGKGNPGCRYSADALLILACLTPWYSIFKFQQMQGEYIRFFCWRTGHLKIWKYMAISSILYYMTMMLYGLALANLSQQCNVFITNGICGCIFVILLVILLSRHRNLYQVTCKGVAAVGAGCIAALFFTIPLHLACAKLLSGPAVQRKLFGILAISLMVIMHALRWFVVKLSCWFLFFNLSGIVSGFLWFCNRDGDTMYPWVIVGGAVLTTVEVVTSVVWKFRGGSPLTGRTQIVEAGIPLSDRTQYMMERMRQL